MKRHTKLMYIGHSLLVAGLITNLQLDGGLGPLLIVAAALCYLVALVGWVTQRD